MYFQDGDLSCSKLLSYRNILTHSEPQFSHLWSEDNGVWFGSCEGKGKMPMNYFSTSNTMSSYVVISIKKFSYLLFCELLKCAAIRILMGNYKSFISGVWAKILSIGAHINRGRNRVGQKKEFPLGSTMCSD